MPRRHEAKALDRREKGQRVLFVQKRAKSLKIHDNELLILPLYMTELFSL